MVPFDRDAIDPQLLTERELTLLNEYHKKVYETLSPYLEGKVHQWIRTATSELIKK
jgi:Xaa-Pro aminopeptidase